MFRLRFNQLFFRMLDISFKSEHAPEQGAVLISDPFLNEDFFRRSVIVLCEHTAEGSFGFVLNNFLDIDLHDIDTDFPDIKARISVGGPVETESLFFLHTFDVNIPGSIPIRKGLFLGGNFDAIKEQLNDSGNHHRIRFFLGYSGWGKDQLDTEMKENSWLVAKNINNVEVMDTKGDNHWKMYLHKQGERFKAMTDFPINPNLN